MSSLFGIGGGGNVGAAGGFYPYSIDQSLRFNDNDSAYLSKTYGSAGNAKTFTISCWIKRANINTTSHICASYDGSSTRQFRIFFTSNGEIQFGQGGAGTSGIIKTNAVFRDVSSWYHCVFVADYSNATAADRAKIYVNGELQTVTTTDSFLNADGHWLKTYEMRIGRTGSPDALYFDGYIAEFHCIDGTALDATSFGEEVNGVWRPVAYSGSYGTNGFYLSFADSSAIGDDLSGNTNDFTATNLAASDVVPDSPTNNWATFNPLDQNDASGLTYPTVYSEGNLKVAQATGFINRKATFGMTGGKWYWEIKINDSSPDSFFGVSKSTGDVRGALDNDEAMIRLTNGDLYTNAATSSYGTAFSNGDVCILAVDMDAGKFWAGRNGTWFASGDPAAGTNEGKSGLASELFPSVSLADGENCDVNFGQNGTFNGTKTAGGNSDGNGYGDFLYTVPSSFLALNSANLPEPTISPNAAEQADDYFTTMLHTGTGSQQAVTGAGFAPDFRWTKSRGSAYSHILHDNVRGETAYLQSNNANSENTLANMSLDSDGFTVHADDLDDPQVSWLWKAGGTAVSNTDGSITSSVSAAPDAGFSIVSYTGNATAGATVGHGLSFAPEFLILKNRSTTDNWISWGSIMGNATDFIQINSTGAAFDPGGNYNNDTNPSSSVITLGSVSDVNGSGSNYIAYCFHSVDGFSKVGSYVGNGSTDGTFVYTGFRPAWIMIKRTDSTGSWSIFDTARNDFNVVDDRLVAQSSAAELTNNSSLNTDIVSNGFKLKNNYSDYNASGGTYIYLAIGDSFKYANAR